MKVAPKRVVSLEYSLHLGDHQVIDSSEGEPLSYLHGTAQIIPGLERQLEGMEPGESKQVTIAPADGYGERDPSNVQEVPRTAFGDRELHEGDELVAIDDEQNEVPVRIEKLVGDKVMALFASSQDASRDADAALRASLAIQDRIGTLNHERGERGLVPIVVGIGVNTGEVVLGNVGSEERMNFTAIGDAVNIAARLGDMAEPGQIIACEATVTAAGQGFVCQPLPPASLKGKSQPIAVFSVVEERRGE